MMARNDGLVSTITTRTMGGSESQMAAIIERLNVIGGNPLCQDEAVELHRAYTAEMVRYFDAFRAQRANAEHEPQVAPPVPIRD